MRIVVDCNVVISAGITKNGSCDQVIEHVIGFHDWIVTVAIVEEYREVARRPRLKAYGSVLKTVVDRIEAFGCMVEPTEDLDERLPDLGDEIYLKAALSANAALLITGNKKHFPLQKYRNTTVLSPREFLDLIGDR
jgi:putative PIN family toxin of toxin-antitoxin system